MFPALAPVVFTRACRFHARDDDPSAIDPLDALKKACPKTKHMMLFRGQNIVAYKHFPDDVVEAFVKANAAAGQDVFRIFDALNDIRNLTTAIKTVIDCRKRKRRRPPPPALPRG